MRRVTVDAFAIAAGTVTNAQFAAFVNATAYRTDAERYGWSFVFAGLLPPGFPPTRAVVGTPWWRQVHGADWRHPEGCGSTLKGRDDHPVVHVSWNDAMAYCAWAAFEPNGYGLFNMTGNVREWCADWFSAHLHRNGRRMNPRGPRDGTGRVMRAPTS